MQPVRMQRAGFTEEKKHDCAHIRCRAYPVRLKISALPRVGPRANVGRIWRTLARWPAIWNP